MNRYLLLLRNDDHDVDDLGEPDWNDLFARFVSWTEDLHRRGRFEAVARLGDPAGGRTLRRRGGALTVDGPYAEGKEAIVGLFIILARDHDEAMHIAGEAPVLDFGGQVEVRELGSFPPPDGHPVDMPAG